ncbi:ArsC family transcriptional regulator [Opitutaceae bacterium EW11]|nr:ArsC family transcriptional regulator [Opitutaceae bacterium EW11]
MPKPLVVFTYSGCSTCRDAVTWLRKHDLAFEEKPIRETPPSVAELKRMLSFQGGELRRLFNTSGLEYKALDLKTKLPGLSEGEALHLLSTNGRLVKRPFLLGGAVGLVGFKPDVWKSALAAKRA